jgi:hypothetical protein
VIFVALARSEAARLPLWLSQARVSFVSDLTPALSIVSSIVLRARYTHSLPIRAREATRIGRGRGCGEQSNPVYAMFSL